MITAYFDSSLCQASPVQKDYCRVVNYDASGNEYITYEEVDYPSIQASLGKVSDWSLSSLLKAAINPSFPIHTGNPTRLDGLDALGSAIQEADAILSEMNEKKED